MRANTSIIPGFGLGAKNSIIDPSTSAFKGMLTGAIPNFDQEYYKEGSFGNPIEDNTQLKKLRSFKEGPDSQSPMLGNFDSIIKPKPFPITRQSNDMPPFQSTFANNNKQQMSLSRNSSFQPYRNNKSAETTSPLPNQMAPKHSLNRFQGFEVPHTKT